MAKGAFGFFPTCQLTFKNQFLFLRTEGSFFYPVGRCDAKERGERTCTGEDRKLKLQLCDIDDEFTERYLGYSEVSKTQCS